MVLTLVDVQAEEGAGVTDIDHARPPVVLTWPSHGTDRHIHIAKSLPLAKTPVVTPLISGLSMPPEPVATPLLRQEEGNGGRFLDN